VHGASLGTRLLAAGSALGVVVAWLALAMSPAAADTTSTFTASAGLQNTSAPTVSPDNDPYNWEHQIVLTANPGTWSGTAPISYAYQWQMCNGNDPTVSGFSCKNAVGDGRGSTSASFTPGSADVSLYPRVAVTATDSASPTATVTTYSLPTHQQVQPLLPPLTGVKCQPSGTPKGTIIYLHAGGFYILWSYDGAKSYCQVWTARGYDVDVVAYPVWDIPGAEASAVEAAASAPAAPVFALGESAGGTLAEWLAVHGDVKAAVSVAGISDLSTWATSNDSYWARFNNNTGMTLAQRAAASPLEAVRGATAPAPLLMFSSPADTVVPYQQSVNLRDALQAKCGTCGSLTNLTGDHLQDKSWDAPAASWLDRMLSAPPRPVLTAVRQPARTWREGNNPPHISLRNPTRPPLGTTFSFTLNLRATVTFSFKHSTTGRKVNARCVAQTKQNRNKPRCRRTITAGTLTFTGRQGANKVSFTGRVSRTKKLGLGTYTLVISATNASGRSAPRTLTFTIVK
jgi:acetyl esterase/lipase